MFFAAVQALCLDSKAQGNPPLRPSYEPKRQNEDWSLRAKSGNVKDPDRFDPWKYIPLTRTGSVWVSFGGQIRERFEGWNQFNFGAPVTAVHDDSFLYSRLMLHADLHIGTHVRVFVQEKNSFSTHRALVGGRRTSDVDELDLQNGFVVVKLPLADASRLTLRAGRQELSLGKERFVGVSDWSNVRRTWDGFSGNLERRKSQMVFFWAGPVQVDKYGFNRPDPATQFYGVHLNRKLAPAWGTVEVYWYGLDNRLATYNGTTGGESRHTLGGHQVNQIGKTTFDFDLGGSIQVGSVGSQNVLAHAMVTQWGYTMRNTWSTPRFYLGYDNASGDRQQGSNVGTFNLLFPTAHSTLGYADVVGRQNLQDLNFGGGSQSGAQVEDSPRRVLLLARPALNDAFYDKRCNVVRPASAGLPRKIGEEADLSIRYQWDVHTLIQSGYSHFFPGAFVRQSGPHEPVKFFYLSFPFTI